MSYSIPNQYKNTLIFPATLKNFTSRWDLDGIRSAVKDPEFRDIYYQNAEIHRSNSHEEIAFSFNVQIIHFDGFKYISHGGGDKIFLSTKLKKSRLYLDSKKFYYLPDVILKYPQITDLDGIVKFVDEAKSSDIATNLDGPNCPLISKRFVYLENKFDLSIDIWEKKIQYDDKFSNKSYKYTHYRVGAFEKKSKVVLHYQSETDTLYLIQDLDGYFINYLKCKNFDHGCNYIFSKKTHLKTHEKGCKTLEEIKDAPQIKQIEYGPSEKLMKKAQKHGLISIPPVNSNFLFFDIECVLPKSIKTSFKTTIHSTHELVSIAANSYINGKHCQKFWSVQDSSTLSRTLIVKNFLNFCYEKRDEMLDNLDLDLALEKLEKMSSFKNYDNFSREEIFELKYKLESYKDLCIFGFNSSKYDNNILMEYIVKVLDDSEKEIFEARSMKILKKCNKYFSVKFKRLHFKDLLNFTCPMNLDKYLKTWTSGFEKLVYPYEHFSSIEEIRNCTQFPDKRAFHTLLKGDVDVLVYEKCKTEFDRRIALPISHLEKWYSFEDYLRYYNLSDVYPASCALIKHFETFETNFGISPMQFLGLPSYAKEAMFKFYDEDCPSIFSFPKDSSATQYFRQNIIGGLCNVYKRHVTLLDEDASPAAKFNSKGKC